MADADMAETIDHALAVENAIGGDEIVDRRAEIGRRLRPHAGGERRQHDHGEASECPAKAADCSAHRCLHLGSCRGGTLTGTGGSA
jgi:hypothetical protein